MSLEEIEKDYVDRLLDFHLSNRTPPSQFLTWENLTKCPTLLIDKRLDGLDWDTIPGLFDHVNAIKATHIDLDIATGQWMTESYDVFNPDGVVSQNLTLALFLMPNNQLRVEPLNDVIRDNVFSAVVIYKLTVQNTGS